MCTLRTSDALLPISAAACIRMAMWNASIVRRTSPASSIRMAVSIADGGEFGRPVYSFNLISKFCKAKFDNRLVRVAVVLK